MKSRTSLFNPTAFKKDITRFAPAWVLYTVGLFMILTVVMTDHSEEYYTAANLADSVSFMALLNLGYGFLNGQLLFGDLFNARNCNALHAMPLRRECWFTTHVVSGLLFALVPNALMALVALPMLAGGWQVALWWLLAVDLQYLFFFGLAVLSALCVGNRFAMALVYGIINFFSLIVYWFYHTLYEPLLYGVYISEEPFLLWCPVWQMMDQYNLIEVGRREVFTGSYNEYFVESVAPGLGWGYLAICAVLGVVFVGLALVLYRRRKLESAGDFMAVRALEPVFLVLYTLCMGAGFQVFADLFGTAEWLFLALGLLVGFFTGRMLLMRTTRVFQLKGFLWFGVLAAAFGATLLATWLDPLGITRYIPDAGHIKAVKIADSSVVAYSDKPMLTDEADIETIRQIHHLVLDGQTESTTPDMDYYTALSLYYVLDNGVTVTRSYQVAYTSPAGQLAQTLYTRADFVLGTDDADAFVDAVGRVYYDDYQEGVSGELYMNYTNREYIHGLVEAILADCAEGTMAQSFGYLHGEQQGWVEFTLRQPVGSAAENDGNVVEYYNYVYIPIYNENRHITAYLEANPFPVEEGSK